MSRIEVFSGVERRRRWSPEEKLRLVTAAFSPGAVVSEVARRADIHPNQLYRWRQDLGVPLTGFAEVVVSGDLEAPGVTMSSGSAPMIEVAFASGAQVRLPISVSPTLASAVIDALVRR